MTQRDRLTVFCFSPLSRIHAPLTGPVTFWQVSTSAVFQSTVEDSCPTDELNAKVTANPLNSFSPLSRIHAPLTEQEEFASSGWDFGFSPLSRIHAPLTPPHLLGMVQ